MSVVIFVNDDAQPSLGKCTKHFLSVVRRAVVHCDDFEVIVAAFLSEDAAQAVGQILRVVVARYNKGNEWCGLYSTRHGLSQSIECSLMTSPGTPTAVTPSRK